MKKQEFYKPVLASEREARWGYIYLGELGKQSRECGTVLKYLEETDRCARFARCARSLRSLPACYKFNEFECFLEQFQASLQMF